MLANRLVFPSQELVRALARIPGDEEVLQADVATLGVGGARLQDVEQAHAQRQNRLQDFQLLHYEFKPRGVYVTAVPAGLTDTPVLAKLEFDPRTMPLKPMSVEQCVSEGLNALRENRSRIVPGRMNRIMNALVPASVKRTMTAKMLGNTPANKPTPASARAQALSYEVRNATVASAM